MERSCFGCVPRESGHSRVPAPAAMITPYCNQANFRLVESPGRELLWVTGLHCDLVGKDGKSEISREFFCHSNLTFTKQERESKDFTSSQDFRLFTLIPGSLEIELPAGFG